MPASGASSANSSATRTAAVWSENRSTSETPFTKPSSTKKSSATARSRASSPTSLTGAPLSTLRTWRSEPPRSLVYWAALVGVMQQLPGHAAAPDRYRQGIDDQLRGHLRFHRPADHPTRVQIQHDGHVQPTLVGPDVGEVGQPLPVRRVGLELALQQIRRDAMPSTMAASTTCPLPDERASSNAAGIPIAKYMDPPAKSSTRFRRTDGN